MAAFEMLIGEWELSGDTSGTVRYEWLKGKHFLMQTIDMQLFGQRVEGIEIIGHLKPFGEEPGKEIRSRAYDSQGNTLDYVYEINGGELTIWGGERGSPAYFKGSFGPDGNSNTGAWVYPPDGGYRSVMTRVHPKGGK